MSGQRKHASLAKDIAIALGNDRPVPGKLPARCALMAGVALAILQSQPATALSLGELRVQSALGERFVATTTARIGAGESIAPAASVR